MFFCRLLMSDLARGEARGQDAQAVAPLGVHRVGDDLVRHRRNGQFDQAGAVGDLDLAGDEGAVGINCDLVDFALGDFGGRGVVRLRGLLDFAAGPKHGTEGCREGQAEDRRDS
jgi:hypothetical protein